MFQIPNTNAYIRLIPNDTRPEAIRCKDVLLAHRRYDLNTGEISVIFSRTTPEKIAEFKSLKPLMLAARKELDELMKQRYLKTYGTDIPSEQLKNVKHLLSISTENKFSFTEKQLKKSLDTDNSKIDQDRSGINKLSNGEANTSKILKKALSAESFQNLFMKTI